MNINPPFDMEKSQKTRHIGSTVAITLLLAGIALFLFSGALATAQTAPTADIKVNGGNGPITVTVGDTVHFSWTATNANYFELTLSGAGQSAPMPPQCVPSANGSCTVTVVPELAGYTYTIAYRATNTSTGQTALDSVTVTVNNQTTGYQCANGNSLTLAEFKDARAQGFIVVTLNSNNASHSASGTVVNNTECSAPVSMSSYKMFDAVLSHQQYFSGTAVYTVPAHGSRTLSVSLPTCAWQDDIWYGNHPHVLQDIDYPNYITGDYSLVGGFCTTPTPTPTHTPTSTPTPTPTPTQTPTPTPTPNPVSCLPNDQSVEVGHFANFAATGGTGSYAWTAFGGDPNSGNGATFATRYFTSGTKFVNVTSGTREDTCVVHVEEVTQDLRCFPSDQTVNRNEFAFFSATGGSDTYTWSASGGNPGSGSGNTFSTRYSSTGSKTVLVHSGSQTATCDVTVEEENQNDDVVCSPSSQTVDEGEFADFTVSGGNSPFHWSAPDGSPSSGSGRNFSTRYFDADDTSQTVRVEDDDGDEDTCTVHIGINNNDRELSVEKRVRNISEGTSLRETVSADSGDTVEFEIEVRADGNDDLQDVRLRDNLPFGLTYEDDSTRVDGSRRNDTITSGGLSLGDMDSGDVITVRFRARVSHDSFFSNGTTRLVNRVTASADNAQSDTDTAEVEVQRGTTTQSGLLEIHKYGRNLSRGETGELADVTSSPNQTIEFIIHVRSNSSDTLRNVRVTDFLPSELTYISNTTSVNGIIKSDGIVSGGINIGTLSSYQEAIIRFSAQARPDYNFPTGTTTVYNRVQATADSTPTVEAQLPISITKGTTTVITTVKTGVDSFWLAGLASAVFATFFAAYDTSLMAGRRKFAGVLKRHRGRREIMNFLR